MKGRTRKVQLKSPVMKRNDEAAALNRKVFQESGLLCLNLMSSPGAGKTTLLEGSLRSLATGLR